MFAVGDFAADTEVSGSNGRYHARLSRDWEIWGPNGGYVAAVALRAAGAASPHRRPATFACHFLSVAEFGDVDVEVVSLRVSKRAASLRVSMTQGERRILEAIVWTVSDNAGIEHNDTVRPDVPGPEGLPSSEELMGPESRSQRHAFWMNLETRPIEWIPWEERRPGPALWREWYRFRPRATCDDPFADAGRYLLLIDTMVWPAACQAHPGQTSYLAPSLDVTAHFHTAAAEAEWLLCDATAPIASDGLIHGRASIWSPDGRLLASGGSQLFCRPTPS